MIMQLLLLFHQADMHNEKLNTGKKKLIVKKKYNRKMVAICKKMYICKCVFATLKSFSSF